MHLEYPSFGEGGPGPAHRLNVLPGSVFSGRKRLAKGVRGVFFCYALPALDSELGDFTREAGTTRWYLFELDRQEVLEGPGDIVESIRSKPNTPRRCVTEDSVLKDVRAAVLKHIKDTYLKRLDCPLRRRSQRSDVGWN